MRVYLGCGYGFMAQHVLNGPKICATFYQMCGKTVPQGVWTDVFFDARINGSLFHNIEDHDSRKRCPSPIEENMVFSTFFNAEVRTDKFEIV